MLGDLLRMQDLQQALWITNSNGFEQGCPVFKKKFTVSKSIKSATIQITALGVYRALINNQQIGSEVLTPGWTNYKYRLQYQTYDVTSQIREQNTITITVGRGWYSSPMPGWIDTEEKRQRYQQKPAVIAMLVIEYENGEQEIVGTDQSWQVSAGKTRFSEIYDGEYFDATFDECNWAKVAEYSGKLPILVSQIGENIKEQEQIFPKQIFRDNNDSVVIDFGQEVTGYVEIELTANFGDKVQFTHGEMLDKDGNFYNENYRSAQAKVTYICNDGPQKWHPQYTFFGFRYIRVDQFPGEATKKNFVAISVRSDIKRTGRIKTSNSQLNQLISNIFWSQKDNFLDVPTDCPQRDERLGWTGDAAAFVKAASYNFNVEKFFKKWLGDVRSEQSKTGAIYDVSPDYLNDKNVSSGWGDVITIVPWQLFMTYGDSKLLGENFEAMTHWVDYITSSTQDEFLWTGAVNFGDWLGLDSPEGSYKGSSRDDFIASAFYYHSTDLVVRAGNVLKKNVDAYKKLKSKIYETFHRIYPTYKTQTECVLALEFGLAINPQQTSQQLVDLIEANEGKMATGFIGTPHLLHALSNNGFEEVAYALLLKEEYPSWLYSVEKGATTTWEHWDSLKDDGTMWSTDMNSFNHYAYGSVIDWMYEVMGGIKPVEPGFKRISIKPKTTTLLEWAEVSLDTCYGKTYSSWKREQSGIRYEISTPVETDIEIDGVLKRVKPGSYIFWGDK